MQTEKLKKLRAGICAGSLKRKKEFLNYLDPIINNIVGKLNPDSSLRRRREKIIRQLSLEILYSGSYPDDTPLENYLKGLFSEIFSSTN